MKKLIIEMNPNILIQIQAPYAKHKEQFEQRQLCSVGNVLYSKSIKEIQFTNLS